MVDIYATDIFNMIKYGECCNMDPTLFSGESMEFMQGASLVIALIVLFLGLIGAIIKFFLWVKILSKAGYSKGFAFLLCAPFGAFIIMCILAFGDWPDVGKSKETPETSDDPKISS